MKTERLETIVEECLETLMDIARDERNTDELRQRVLQDLTERCKEKGDGQGQAEGHPADQAEGPADS